MPEHDDSWIFTKDSLPDKNQNQILVDMYPVSGVHVYEVLEYMKEFNSFCSYTGDDIIPIVMDDVLCWKPIYPPSPRKA